MTTIYVLSKRLFLKCGGLSDTQVVLFIKKEYGFAVFFIKTQVFKVKI